MSGIEGFGSQLAEDPALVAELVEEPVRGRFNSLPMQALVTAHKHMDPKTHPGNTP